MTDAVFCLVDLSWPRWFWDFQFCSPPFSLCSVLCCFFSSPFFFSSTVTLQSLPFCFSLNFRHNYCIIAGDRESVVVDVLLSFLTDTQPSALFSVGVYPSHPHSLFHNMISCVYWREGSVSIDTDDNIPVFGLLARGGHIKTEGRGEAALIEFLDKHWPFFLYLDHLRVPLSLKGKMHFGSYGTLPEQWCLAVSLLPTIKHYNSGTTIPSTACGYYCPSVQVDECLWLVKSVALSRGLLVSGSNWHGGRQVHLSHVVSHDWPD